MQIGDRIKELRKERCLSVRALAEKTGMSFGFLSDVENNHSNPSIATCDKIADALGVPVSRLLGELPEDTVKQEGDTFTATWQSAEAGKLAELLRTFDDWKIADRQELLAYLSAKEAARSQTKTQKDSR